MNSARRTIKISVQAAVFGACIAFATNAYAHAQLVKAEPAQRATVTDAPKQVRLWFNEEIEGSYAKLGVVDGGAKPVTDAKPTIAADDSKSLVLALPVLSPGKYTVKYRVLSIDGHVVESSYDFTLNGKPPEK